MRAFPKNAKGDFTLKLYGTYQASSKGFGFLMIEDGEGPDWFIPPHCDGGAWNGDKVYAEPKADRFGGDRKTAEITSVAERTNRTVTGAIEKRGRETWLIPSSDRLSHPIHVVGRTGGLKDGEMAAVAVQSYGSRKAPPMGTLRETFGKSGTRKAAVEAILYHYGIERDFPAAVDIAAEAAPQEVETAAVQGRLDLRDKRIITIDGATAKDLDDAVSLERDDSGRLVLGVHIADVSHYVREGTPLDLEAWNRGTSVYFADQVIPMLPKALSNGICSLNPQVDRLALSCIMTLGNDGSVVEHTIAKSVIRTTERMTYDDCNALLAGSDAALAEKYAHILPMLRDMAALAAQLEKRRRTRGALDLESRECYLVCDETGAVADIRLRESGLSEKLIESFMLIANETVAEHLQTAQLPGVYRVHEKPSEDKTNSLRAMLAPLGYDLREADNFSLQKVLEAARDTPQSPAIHTMVLRSLMKARYEGENLGHFGLAAKFYCHFTSPIRRYPDLMVHRILSAALDGTMKSSKMAAKAQQAAVQSSDREVAAMNAEREIEKCYLAEYMRGHIGESFTGAVSGVTKFGLFVGLENGVEGLVGAAALPGDRYEYDEVRMTLTGARTGTVYSFGMPLEVTCVAADPGSGQIDFILTGTENAPRRVLTIPKEPPHGKNPAGKRTMHVPKKKRGRGKR
ncbi:MAG: ribonuclease R [Clostridia bacterium]|nr:ribonuclease R [Clostridia bacterium]